MLDERVNDESILRKIPHDKIDSKAVFEAAVKGDKIAKEVFKFTGQILGEALANFVMFSSPEAIILFGGVIKAGKDINGSGEKTHGKKPPSYFSK